MSIVKTSHNLEVVGGIGIVLLLSYEYSIILCNIISLLITPAYILNVSECV